MSDSYEAAVEVRAAVDCVRDELTDLRIVLRQLVYLFALRMRDQAPMGSKTWNRLNKYLISHGSSFAERTDEKGGAA